MEKSNLFKNIIEESHKRCTFLGLSPDNIYSKRILSGKELNDVLTENKQLINIAEPFMKLLNDFVKSSNFLTILTDNQGIILRIFGNDKMLKEASNLKMIPGASMAEEDIGTNAMGTVLYCKSPLQLIADDHFVKAYHRWTCSCAPVIDSENKVIGTLDLTGDTDFVHTHTLGMVVAASYALTNALKAQDYHNQILKAKLNLESIFNSIPYAIITADIYGNILYFNDYFIEYFAYDKHTVTSKKMWDFFDGWNNVLDTLNQNNTFLDEDVYVSANKNVLQFSLSAYPVFSSKNSLNEIVFIFKDVKKVRKLANRIMGRKAVYTFDKIITENQIMLEIIDFCKKVADSKSTVLITGESGTGKEIFAQSIHNFGKRKEESFIAVNCGALPKTLIESELFGYADGAFTGAKRGGQAGKFELSDGGTIFLDEIGEMPLDMQINLLRVIEEGYLTRVGSSIPIPVDVRIIAATNKDLRQEVKNGNFRKDLFYRLNVLPVHLPPLRERKMDIPLLITYFMNYLSKRLNKKPIFIPNDYMNQLLDYKWQGNIRELENFVELIINTEKLPDNIDLQHLNVETIKTEHKESNLVSLATIEESHIRKVLEYNDFNIMKSAKVLGISRNTLYRKMSDFDISSQ